MRQGDHLRDQQPEPVREERPPAQETVNPAQNLEYTVEDTPKPSGSLGMIDMSGVRGDDEPDEETDSPPGR